MPKQTFLITCELKDAKVAHACLCILKSRWGGMIRFEMYNFKMGNSSETVHQIRAFKNGIFRKNEADELRLRCSGVVAAVEFLLSEQTSKPLLSS